MYKVKVIKDSGCHKKGIIKEMADYRAESLARKGIVKIIKYSGCYVYSEGRVNAQIEKTKEHIARLQSKLSILLKFKASLKETKPKESDIEKEVKAYLKSWAGIEYPKNLKVLEAVGIANKKAKSRKKPHQKSNMLVDRDIQVDMARREKPHKPKHYIKHR